MIARARFGYVLLVAIASAACDGAPDNAAERPATEQGKSVLRFELEPIEPGFVLGGPAPDFTLPVMRVAGGTGADVGAMGGGTAEAVTLSQQRGHVVFITFWSTACGPCVAEHPTLNEVATTYADRGVRFFGILDADTPESLRRFVDEHGPTTFPNLYDPEGNAKRSYHARGWPLHVVIDGAGQVAWWQHGGPIEEQRLRDVLDDVLAGRKPDIRWTGAVQSAPT